MASRYREFTAAVETHWSLFTMVRNNWGWIAAALGLSGLNGWLAWLWQSAAGATWYQKALWTSLGVLVTAFTASGIRAFLAWHRRSIREKGAIAAGISWSGHTYANGSIIQGGTHRLVEIFGTDQLRSNLTFRNCQVLGPGIVA